MADAEELESSGCYTMIDLDSLGSGTPNSLCSTPELEIRGTENCLGRDSKHSPKGDESFPVNCESRSFANESSAAILKSKKREFENNESFPSDENCKE